MHGDDLLPVLDLFAVGVLIPIAFYTGWRRYRTGAIPEDSVEYVQVRALVNLNNAWWGQPRVERLTAEQIRRAGLWYMAITAIGFLLALAALLNGEW